MQAFRVLICPTARSLHTGVAHRRSAQMGPGAGLCGRAGVGGLQPIGRACIHLCAARRHATNDAGFARKVVLVNFWGYQLRDLCG